VPLTSKTLSFVTAVEKLESLVKEIVEIDERAHKLGISKEEYALLNVAKKYLSNRSDSDLTAFVKELDREIKTMLFPGWWRGKDGGGSRANAV
jgi:hypothetical protein